MAKTTNNYSMGLDVHERHELTGLQKYAQQSLLQYFINSIVLSASRRCADRSIEAKQSATRSQISDRLSSESKSIELIAHSSHTA